MKIILIIISLFLSGGVSMSQELNDPIWSQPVKGLQARIILKYNRTVNDTPIITAYLELCNVSEVATLLKITWDNGRNIYFNVVDDKGVKLPPSTFPYNGESPYLEEIILPYESTLKFKISEWGAYIPKNEKVLIDLGHPYVWIIKRDDEKDYFLKATLEIKKTIETNYEKYWWYGKIEIPKVKITEIE